MKGREITLWFCGRGVSKYLVVTYVLLTTLGLQAQSQETYTGLVEGMICNLAEVGLKSEGQTAALKRFEKEIKASNQCDYVHVRPFLRGLTPAPESLLELINLLYFEYRGASIASLSNEQQAAMLMDFFEEPAYTAFAERHLGTMEGYKSDTKGLIYEAYGVVPPGKEAADKADAPDTVVIAPVGARPDVPAKATEKTEPKYGLWVQRLLLWAMIFLILAVALYFGWQYYEDRQERKQEQAEENAQSRGLVAMQEDVYGKTLTDMQDQIDRQSLMLNGLMKEIEDLHERLSKVMEENQAIMAAPQAPRIEVKEEAEAPATPPAVTPPTRITAPVEAGVVFGASPTQAEGKFLAASAESPLLEVEVLETEAKASFQLHPDKTWSAEDLAQWAGQYPELLKVLNTYEPTATRLATMEEGLLEWKEGQWEVVAKALVYFK